MNRYITRTVFASVLLSLSTTHTAQDPLSYFVNLFETVQSAFVYNLASSELCDGLAAHQNKSVYANNSTVHTHTEPQRTNTYEWAYSLARKAVGIGSLFLSDVVLTNTLDMVYVGMLRALGIPPAFVKPNDLQAISTPVPLHYHLLRYRNVIHLDASSYSAHNGYDKELATAYAGITIVKLGLMHGCKKAARALSSDAPAGTWKNVLSGYVRGIRSLLAMDISSRVGLTLLINFLRNNASSAAGLQSHSGHAFIQVK